MKRRTEHARFDPYATHEAIVEGAAKRLASQVHDVLATMSIGLVPDPVGYGAGSAIMKRIAAPMVGGIVTSFLLELLVYPAIYAFWREREIYPEG